ncbi:MAG: hypothetical protein GY715_19420 [Planctomycetes bacterium]|nr:hypothetical protein [Planctomycetota bacterium]
MSDTTTTHIETTPAEPEPTTIAAHVLEHLRPRLTVAELMELTHLDDKTVRNGIDALRDQYGWPIKNEDPHGRGQAPFYVAP